MYGKAHYRKSSLQKIREGFHYQIPSKWELTTIFSQVEVSMKNSVFETCWTFSVTEFQQRQYYVILNFETWK